MAGILDPYIIWHRIRGHDVHRRLFGLFADRYTQCRTCGDQWMSNIFGDVTYYRSEALQSNPLADRKPRRGTN